MTPLGREWVRKAEFDRRTVLKEKANPPVVHASVCFHCQQLAEKYLKALLCELGLPVPRTHDCRVLVASLIPLEPELAQLTSRAKVPTRFAVDPRYSGFQLVPSDSRTAWNAAERIRAEVRRRLGLRPRP